MLKQILIGGCVGLGLAIASIPAQAQTTPAAPTTPSAMPAAPASQAAPHHANPRHGSSQPATPEPASPGTTSPQGTTPSGTAPSGATPQGTSPQQTTNVSSAEIQQFTDALKQMRTIHDEAQTQATQAIQAQGLTPERFSQIVQSQETAQAGASGSSAAPGASGAPAASGTAAAPGASAPAAPVSSAEKQKFDKALAEVTQIQQSTEQKMEQAIQQAGLDVQRFQEIFAMARQDQALKAKIQQGLQN
jgi:Domain of unknown function (DUF4168)